MRRRTDLITAADIPAALGLLTRLPVPVPADALARGARAAWAWPLAGVAVAAPAGLAGALALALGLTPLLAAGLTVLAQVMLTGALHEDGLADSADGLWGGWTRERRLEIMKDSRSGAYGVIALALALILRVSALAALMEGEGWIWGLVAVAAASRAGMAGLAAALPSARPGGLSGRVGRPEPATAWTGIALALAVALAATGGAMIALAFWTGAALVVWGWIARARIGGQTGDILGAGQQVAEIAGLCVLVAVA